MAHLLDLKPEQLREKARRRDLVARGNDCVIESYRHGLILGVVSF
jgi:hypothetical protein